MPGPALIEKNVPQSVLWPIARAADGTIRVASTATAAPDHVVSHWNGQTCYYQERDTVAYPTEASPNP